MAAVVVAAVAAAVVVAPSSAEAMGGTGHERLPMNAAYHASSLGEGLG